MVIEFTWVQLILTVSILLNLILIECIVKAYINYKRFVKNFKNSIRIKKED